MPLMPDPPRTDRLAHEEAVMALQRWLWACAAAGWDPMEPSNARWSHEDNMEAMRLGWMIAQPPGSKHLDLFSLKQNTPAGKFMDEIVRLAPINPLCARAVVVLSAQKIQYPDIKFNFRTE